MNLFGTREAGGAAVIDTPDGVDPIEELPTYEGLTDFEPSNEQRRIFGFIEQGEGDGIVESVAGSGKTETLLGCAELIPDEESCLICAFNSSVKDELKAELGEEEDRRKTYVKTLHSQGRDFLKESRGEDPDLNRGKMWGIVHQEADELGVDLKGEEVPKICARVKQTCTDPQDGEALEQMATFFGFNWREKYKAVVKESIQASQKMVRDKGVIDYNDMVYVPLQFGVVQKKYDWVFVDEAQDLNKAQQKLALKVCKEDGRCLFVGDENQAINGFQGADPNAIEHIEKGISRRRGNEATRLNLSTCYRCPKSHISKAQEVVPKIKPSDRAQEGTLQKRALENLPEYLESVDTDDDEDDREIMVLCRQNEPLIRWCVKTVLEKGTRAWIQGEDVDGKLKDIIDEAVNKVGEERDLGYEALKKGLARCEKKADTVAEEKQGASPENIRKRVEIVRDVMDKVGERPIQTLKRDIEDYFEESEEGVKFSTIHRAKGQEADCVFVIKPETSFHKSGPEWQKQQEENIRYVMLTRSKGTLVLMPEDADESGTIDRAAEGGYGRIEKEEIEAGDRFDHAEYRRGEVVVTDGRRDEIIIMDFGEEREGFREVNLERRVLKWV
ncbi:UvrD-helicase domain-containing protein [Salinibacter ruber]|jgi:DNA helicase-2/ATP-dependent DNA helicase PcrA|uniref:DNA 3'-5' helicase II n=1 Tax=Salinibacter ruber TaxID=146919 RepID=A0A9X2Q792_9BACT|nr:UvrD-helicase domain-containing protein [Salinibacter ruber]MCS3660195.1 DNA helicase-2/ATP-dependent DNA helicase PcrA [Salinibacter ruber]MCS3709880.1 DNA helicase-2/ATP-dependent DNA helicase PcrA [Salinibacter ruber]MCS4170292.1 DNA helicase-2/ATP-dependent DNA helicase PcrA [Salinibacter ruber]